MDKLNTLLQEGKPILLDGAMGTMLMEAGLESGDSPEEWNALHPEKVRGIHREYIQAGSRIILTNTFGGTSVRMETHGLGDRVIELNKKAAEKFKKGKNEEQYHKEMAWHYYLSSLLSEDKRKREDLKSKAVKETNWLFIANIALSLSKISKKTEKIIYLIKDAISSYERYLDEKGKKLPTFTIFIDGNLRDEQMVKSVTEKFGEKFDTKISPLLTKRSPKTQ